MARRTKAHTRKRINAILVALAEGWSISRACQAADIARRTYYDWRESNPEFAAEADAAIERGTDRLEDIAIERATRPLDGSDTLLIFMLKGRRPSKFRDNSKLEISGPDGGPVPIVAIEVSRPESLDP